MKKSATFAAICSALAICGLVVALQSYRFKKIEKRGPARLFPVGAEFSASVDEMREAILSTFNVWEDRVQANRPGTFVSKFPSASKWSHFYLFRREDTAHPLFPSDDLILLNRGVDDFIRNYVSIPPALRSDDLYLYEPTADLYWPSEYVYRGSPAKFRCSFIIHLEPASDARTRVEVFEYQPEIWVGEKFAFSAHAVLPGMLHDIRFAEPTTSDRVEVLQMIQHAATH